MDMEFIKSALPVDDARLVVVEARGIFLQDIHRIKEPVAGMLQTLYHRIYRGTQHDTHNPNRYRDGFDTQGGL